MEKVQVYYSNEERGRLKYVKEERIGVSANEQGQTSTRKNGKFKDSECIEGLIVGGLVGLLVLHQVHDVGGEGNIKNLHNCVVQCEEVTKARGLDNDLQEVEVSGDEDNHVQELSLQGNTYKEKKNEE